MNNIKAGDYVICVNDTSKVEQGIAYIVKNVYKKYISSKDTLFDLVEINITIDCNMETGTTIVAVDSKMFEKCDLNYEIGDIVECILPVPEIKIHLEKYIHQTHYKVVKVLPSMIGIEVRIDAFSKSVLYFKKQYFVKVNNSNKQVSEEEIVDETVAEVDTNTISPIDEYIFIPEDEMKFVVVNGVKGYMIKLDKKEET